MAAHDGRNFFHPDSCVASCISLTRGSYLTEHGRSPCSEQAVAPALKLLESWTVEQSSVALVLAFSFLLLVSSLALNCYLLWQLRACKRGKVVELYVTKPLSVYHRHSLRALEDWV